MNDAPTMERGRNTKRIPGTIRIVFEAIDNDTMLRRHTGKRWRHSNSFAVRLKQEEATGAQPRINLFDVMQRCSHLRGHLRERRRTPGFCHKTINGNLHASIEIGGMIFRHDCLT